MYCVGNSQIFHANNKNENDVLKVVMLKKASFDGHRKRIFGVRISCLAKNGVFSKIDYSMAFESSSYNSI